MLAIRLSRTGRNKYPTYRIVAAESARAATGKFVAILGHYNPHTKELVLKHDETLKYLSNGAQPSNTVVKLLQREKIKLPDWVSLKTRHTAPKKEPVASAPTTAPVEDKAAEVDAGPNSAEQPVAVAEIAAKHSEAVEAAAPATTDLDSDHTETAASAAAETDKALQVEKVAADAAIDTVEPDKS